jgi:hypothetical protein
MQFIATPEQTPTPVFIQEYLLEVLINTDGWAHRDAADTGSRSSKCCADGSDSGGR